MHAAEHSKLVLHTYRACIIFAFVKLVEGDVTRRSQLYRRVNLEYYTFSFIDKLYCARRMYCCLVEVNHEVV